jgi:hypothetical protein
MPIHRANQPQPLDSLRLNDAESRAIFTDLAGQSSNFGGSNRRGRSRLPWDLTRHATATIHSPGGTINTFLVRPRNISREGMSFLHGGFVYPKSICTLSLMDLSGQTVQVPGRVIRCQHVRGHVHEIGVHFEQPIPLAQFVILPSDADINHADEIRARIVSELERLLQMAETDIDLEPIRQKLAHLLDLVDQSQPIARRAKPASAAK